MVFMYICTEIPGYILEPPVPIYMNDLEFGSCFHRSHRPTLHDIMPDILHCFKFIHSELVKNYIVLALGQLRKEYMVFFLITTTRFLS